jgi:uncharacterized membrane protein
MERSWVTMLMVGEVVVAGTLMLLLPRVTRRGLLFGVYVGEEAWGEDQASNLVRRYTLGGLAWMAVCLASGVGLTIAGMSPRQVIPLVLPMLTLLGFTALYLWAHFRSREMAVTGGPPPAAAVLALGGEGRTILPAIAIVVSVCCGILTMAYAWAHYGQLPERVPSHFNLSGAPDAWRPKSLFTVMHLPLMTMVMGVGLGVLAMFIARAKRAIRYPAAAISAEAQARFRLAMTRYLAVVALVTCALLTNLSVGVTNAGLGIWPTLRGLWVFMGLALATAAGGLFFLTLRHGQGGALQERGAGMAPLTNGLADNRYWALGYFYVNHEDPAILIEARFGLGYTLNLGNWKVVVALISLVGLMMTLAVVPLVAT